MNKVSPWGRNDFRRDETEFFIFLKLQHLWPTGFVLTYFFVNVSKL